jgi:hypothetical protein
MNMYGYVGGDPINLVDPLGLDDQPPIEIKGKLHHSGCGDYIPVGNVCVAGGDLSSLTYNGNSFSFNTYGKAYIEPGADCTSKGHRVTCKLPASPPPERDPVLDFMSSLSPACQAVVREPGLLSVISFGGNAFVLFGGTASVGHFVNIETGASGYFVTGGGGWGADLSIGPSTGIYKGAADLHGYNGNLTATAEPISGTLSFNSDAQLVGGTIGPAAGAGGAFSATETKLFGCTPGSR